MASQTNHRNTVRLAYATPYGAYYLGQTEKALTGSQLRKYRGKVRLILTSPPFPLNRKKRCGNRSGNGYLQWLGEIAVHLRDLLTDDGSVVIEIGNGLQP
jgi:hypothetical protein